MAINSLGIGSGVLTADILDKLRVADEDGVLKPIESKISLATQKDEAYQLLSNLVNSFKSSASTLSDYSIYAGRSVSGDTDAVSVKAESGTEIQNFNISNVQRALNDVWSSVSFDSKSTPMTDDSSGTFTLSIGGKSYDIEYDANSSLNSIRDSINEIAGDDVTASVLMVGKDAYKLTLVADRVGEAITFGSYGSSTNNIAQIDTITIDPATIVSTSNQIDKITIDPSSIVTSELNTYTIDPSALAIAQIDTVTLGPGTDVTAQKDEITLGAGTSVTAQIDTVTIASYNAPLLGSDTFTWGDGTYSVSVTSTLFDDETNIANKIVGAINGDANLSALYTATDNGDGTYTVEAKDAATTFTGVISGDISANEITTTPQDDVELTWDDGNGNIYTVSAVNGDFNTGDGRAEIATAMVDAINTDPNNIYSAQLLYDIDGITVTGYSVTANNAGTSFTGTLGGDVSLNAGTINNTEVVAQDDVELTWDDGNGNVYTVSAANGDFNTGDGRAEIATAMVDAINTDPNNIYSAQLLYDIDGITVTGYSVTANDVATSFNATLGGDVSLNAGTTVTSESIDVDLTWDDGNGNSITVSVANGDFNYGEGAVEIAAAMVSAINTNLTMSGLYTATDNGDGTYTVEAKNAATTFSATLSGSVADDAGTNGEISRTQDDLELTWSDGNGNQITVSAANEALNTGDGAVEIAAAMVNAINTDPTISALYTATDNSDGTYTIESNEGAFTTTLSGDIADNAGSGDETLQESTGINSSLVWDDGNGNVYTVSLANGALSSGDGRAEVATAMVDEINSDPNDIYTAALAYDTDGITIIGYTVEANDANNSFSATLSGEITASEETTTESVVTEVAVPDLLAFENLQEARSATFEYNGIEITRKSNEIDDLLLGVTITLNQDQKVDEVATIDIRQNTTAISSEMEIFVTGYNSLATNLNDMTLSDRDAGTAGIFNDNSFVKSIKRDLLSLIFSRDSQERSLVDYGLDIDRYGKMSIDMALFNAKLAEDSDAVQNFFSGEGSEDGIFTKLDDKLSGYTGYDKLMSNFADRLESEKNSLTQQYDRTKEMLDNRYAILEKKFATYDTIISQINTEFESLQQMIDAQLNNND